MGLTLTQIKQITELSHAQVRNLVEFPFKARGTTIKRHTAGRRAVAYSFSDLAPRLVLRGISEEVISQLARVSALDN